MSCVRVFLTVACLAFGASTLSAQTPQCPCPPEAPPPPVWTGSASAGLGLTSGNTDTRNLNLAFEAVRDAKTKHVLKFGGLYLWSEQDGEQSANRLSLMGRDEYKLSARAFAFGQLQYMRDPFKEIDYLIAPTGGVGYKLYDTERLKLSADGGVGAVWEKNPGEDVDVSGAVTAGEQFAFKLSPTATLTQSFGGLWKMNDFGDGLYTYGAGISASLTTKTAVKLEILDTYKSRTPSPDVKKNDVALLASLVYKF